MATSSFFKKFVVTEEFADQLAETLNREPVKTEKSIENFKSKLTSIEECPALLKALCSK